MPDDIDNRQPQDEADLARRIAAARGDIPPGQPGECELCGEWFARLVGGACVPCRNKYKL